MLCLSDSHEIKDFGSLLILIRSFSAARKRMNNRGCRESSRHSVHAERKSTYTDVNGRFTESYEHSRVQGPFPVLPHMHTCLISPNGYARNLSGMCQWTGTADGTAACRIGFHGYPQRQDSSEDVNKPSFVQVSQKCNYLIHKVSPFLLVIFSPLLTNASGTYRA